MSEKKVTDMALWVLLTSVVVGLAAAHSQLTQPQSTSPVTCRLGGEPQFGVGTCVGPCDLTAIEGGYANYDSPNNPAATYARGEKVTMYYQRNNHRAGGFIRLALVPPDKMMDKDVHAKNAFHYTCWGGQPRRARPDELGEDRFGFSLIGSDGEQHEFPPGFYTMDVTIPKVVPDGPYVLGWVWYGGTGAGITTEGPEEPAPYGYFSDYWSCSFIEIKGGAPLERSFTPTYINDMAQFSTEGCMAANDRPGVCSYEPCFVTGQYQRPAPFKNGRSPAALKPEDFGGTSPSGTGGTGAPSTTEARTGGGASGNVREGRGACACIAKGRRCRPRLAGRTGGKCAERTEAAAQPPACKSACCDFCARRPANRRCTQGNVSSVCVS